MFSFSLETYETTKSAKKHEKDEFQLFVSSRVFRGQKNPSPLSPACTRWFINLSAEGGRSVMDVIDWWARRKVSAASSTQ